MSLWSYPRRRLIRLRVENMDAAVAELTEKGAEFTMEPRKLRPGLIITYIVAPENVRIELLQRD